MTKNDIIKKLAETRSMRQMDVREIVDGLFSEITTTISKNENVSIMGFGNFFLVKKNRKLALNPKHPDERFEVPEHMAPRFHFSKVFREEIRAKCKVKKW